MTVGDLLGPDEAKPVKHELACVYDRADVFGVKGIGQNPVDIILGEWRKLAIYLHSNRPRGTAIDLVVVAHPVESCRAILGLLVRHGAGKAAPLRHGELA